jgi:kumamolisin
MSKTRLFAFTVLFSFAFGSSRIATAQDTMTPERPTTQQKPAPAPAGIFKPQGKVITPLSSVSTPGKGGHTNFKIFVPAGHGLSSPIPDYNFAETPASMACVYKVTQVGPNNTGCNPNTGGNNRPSGGWGAIALVDAYDDPNAASDLAFFDNYYGLPQANFTVVYANTSFGTLNGLTADCAGTPPPANENFGWDVEESLDIEWSHVMAPAAHIILVEACDQSLPQLLFAEEVAGIEVSNYGGGDISNSWGYPESCVGNSGCGGGTLTEQQDDNFLFRYYWQDISYFASAGDSGAEVLYPSASPWVVSAGGTTVNRDVNGNFLSESCWSDSGGGSSAVETWQNPPSISNGLGPWANYQYGLFGETFRSTPDISFNADPASGVYVYDTDEGGAWYVVGGTSVSSPALAGIVNASNNRLGQAPPGGGYYEAHENELLYSQLYAKTAYGTNFYDVTTGSNGHAAGTGYDQCTGIGSPRGHLGK